MERRYVCPLHLYTPRNAGVPRADDALYEQAKQYLSRDPVEAKLFTELEHSPDGRHVSI